MTHTTGDMNTLTHRHTCTHTSYISLSFASFFFCHLFFVICICYSYIWLDFQQMILHNQLQTALCETPAKSNPCSASILRTESLDWGEKGLTSFAVVKGKGRWEAWRGEQTGWKKKPAAEGTTSAAGWRLIPPPPPPQTHTHTHHTHPPTSPHRNGKRGRAEGARGKESKAVEKKEWERERE